MRLIKVVNNKRKSIVMGRNSKNKYCKTYHKRAIIEADKDTLGIFCFETRDDAIRWLAWMHAVDYQLLEVKPLTRPKKKIPKIAYTISETGITDYYHYKYYKRPDKYNRQLEHLITPAPQGTVLVRRLQVMS